MRGESDRSTFRPSRGWEFSGLFFRFPDPLLPLSPSPRTPPPPTHKKNRYKEYRDTTLNGAVEQLYAEMGSRHRARSQVLQIIKTATVPAALCKREATKQFHNSAIKFPLTTRRARPESRVHRTVFKAVRPNVAMQ